MELLACFEQECQGVDKSMQGSLMESQESGQFRKPTTYENIQKTCRKYMQTWANTHIETRMFPRGGIIVLGCRIPEDGKINKPCAIVNTMHYVGC